eukprot:1191474-Amphidinium_carterae.2
MLTINFRRAAKGDKLDFYRDRLSVFDGHKQNWAAIRMLRKSYTTLHILRTRKLRASLTEYPEQAADYLEKVHWRTQLDLHLPQRPFVTPPEIVFNSDPFTTGEVGEAIRELKKNKSPGPDSLTAEILQIPPQIAIERFTELLNELRSPG